MIQLPPRPPLFPYTTLFRSPRDRRHGLRRLRPARIEPQMGQRFGDLRARQTALDSAAQVEIELILVAHRGRSEEHTSELQSLRHLVCRLLLEKKKSIKKTTK